MKAFAIYAAILAGNALGIALFGWWWFIGLILAAGIAALGWEYWKANSWQLRRRR